MTDRDDCWACRGGIRHDERPEAECVHRLSDGTSPACCGDAIAERVQLLVAWCRARRGRGPVDAGSLLDDVAVPDSPRMLTDPVGHAMFGEHDGDVDEDQAAGDVDEPGPGLP